MNALSFLPKPSESSDASVSSLSVFFSATSSAGTSADAPMVTLLLNQSTVMVRAVRLPAVSMAVIWIVPFWVMLMGNCQQPLSLFAVASV